MIFQVSSSGENAEASVSSGSACRKRSQTTLLGKGYLQLAQMPSLAASSMASQRCIPLLWTTRISGVKGDASGLRSTTASASTRFSIRLLVLILRGMVLSCL